MKKENILFILSINDLGEFMKQFILLCMTMIYPLVGQPDTLSTDYPFLYLINLKCKISYIASSGVYSYLYVGSNPSENSGDIWKIRIDISRDSGRIVYDTAGLIFDRPYIKENFVEDYVDFGDRVIPVSASKLPNRSWDAGVSSSLMMSISVLGDHIKPGTEIPEKIELMSKGLPGIRRLIVLPDFESQKYFPPMDEPGVEMFSLEKQDSIRNMVNYYGWMVGPSSPPINFIPTVWCDTLISYTSRSRTFGWITLQPAAEKYSGYFTTAKTQLSSGNNSGAWQTLKIVLRDADIDSASTLSSEAYALIRYNTEYLISKMPVWKPENIQGSFAPVPQSVTVTWTPEYSSTMLPNGGGYDLYRAVYYDGMALSFTKLNTSLITTGTYTDNPVIPGSIPVNKDVFVRYYLKAKNNQNIISESSDTLSLFVGKRRTNKKPLR